MSGTSGRIAIVAALALVWTGAPVLSLPPQGGSQGHEESEPAASAFRRKDKPPGMALGLAVSRPAVPRQSAPGKKAERLEGWYTQAQARRGEDLYMKQCAACHGATFVPDDFSPGLTGAAFEWRWKSRTAYDLFEAIRTTMPPGEEGSLGPRATADIVSYLLQVNGFSSGRQELPPEREVLQKLSLTR